MFGFLRRGSRSENGVTQLLEHSAGVRPPLRATGRMSVRRFQGTFECGCEAHPLDEPMECPVHGKPKHYIVERTEVMQTAVVTEDQNGI